MLGALVVFLYSTQSACFAVIFVALYLVCCFFNLNSFTFVCMCL